MEPRCTVCGLKIEREEGYFLGAMYISYAFALLTIAALTALLWTWDRHFFRDILGALLLFLPLAPFLTLFARTVWVYLDHDPEP